MRPFFKATGFALFAMAVVFAGNGVFELQNAGFIKVTPVAWVGLGIPTLGCTRTCRRSSSRASCCSGRP